MIDKFVWKFQKLLFFYIWQHMTLHHYQESPKWFLFESTMQGLPCAAWPTSTCDVIKHLKQTRKANSIQNLIINYIKLSLYKDKIPNVLQYTINTHYYLYQHLHLKILDWLIITIDKESHDVNKRNKCNKKKIIYCNSNIW